MSEPNVNVVTRSQSVRRADTKTITSLAMLTAVAYAVMLLSKLLPSVNGFLDFDFKDVVICISGFIYGPVAAALVSIVVALIEMFTVSHTGIIGCIMNVIATVAFCCTASFVYKKVHTKKGAVVGLTLGTAALVAVMLLWNYLVTPIYQGVPRDVVTAMLPTVFFPFNLAKGGLNMAATLLLYKPIVTALRKARLAPDSSAAPTGKQSNTGFLLFSLALLATFVTLALVLMGIL